MKLSDIRYNNYTRASSYVVLNSNTSKLWHIDEEYVKAAFNDMMRLPRLMQHVTVNDSQNAILQVIECNSKVNLVDLLTGLLTSPSEWLKNEACEQLRIDSVQREAIGDADYHNMIVDMFYKFTEEQAHRFANNKDFVCISNVEVVGNQSSGQNNLVVRYFKFGEVTYCNGCHVVFMNDNQRDYHHILYKPNWNSTCSFERNFCYASKQFFMANIVGRCAYIDYLDMITTNEEEICTIISHIQPMIDPYNDIVVPHIVAMAYRDWKSGLLGHSSLDDAIRAYTNTE